MRAGSQALCLFRYDRQAWYVRRSNVGSRMAFSIFLEAGLQSCGWMAAYMGSALHSESELFFRNLQGEAKLLAQPSLDDPSPIETRVRCTNISKSAGKILSDILKF